MAQLGYHSVNRHTSHKICSHCGKELVYDHYLKLMVHRECGNIFCVYGNVEKGMLKKLGVINAKEIRKVC